MAGLSVKFYQARPLARETSGPWYCHLVPLTPREEREGRSWYDHSLWAAAGVRVTTDQGGRPWASVSGGTLEECQLHATEALGRLYTVRFRRLLRPVTPPQPDTLYPPKEFQL